MSSLLIKNIGEFFTGDIAKPVAPITSLLIDGNTIAALDPPADTKRRRRHRRRRQRR